MMTVSVYFDVYIKPHWVVRSSCSGVGVVRLLLPDAFARAPRRLTAASPLSRTSSSKTTPPPPPPPPLFYTILIASWRTLRLLNSHRSRPIRFEVSFQLPVSPKAPTNRRNPGMLGSGSGLKRAGEGSWLRLNERWTPTAKSVFGFG